MDHSGKTEVMGFVLSIMAMGPVLIGSHFVSLQRQMAKNQPAGADGMPQFRHIGLVGQIILMSLLLLLLGYAGVVSMNFKIRETDHISGRDTIWPVYDKHKIREAPPLQLAGSASEKKLMLYGKDLVVNTQRYYGPDGILKNGAINGLNCQNCHLDAGSRPFGNNYFAVESTYPQLRARSGSFETIPMRINDCFQRSLNGQPIDSNSIEMKALIAYISWLGTGVPKGERPKGSGLPEVEYLTRAANPILGEKTYVEKCATCHGKDGSGSMISNGPQHYPPLWGDKSFNQGAGLYRMSRMAGFIKANMPFGTSYQNPQLTDEEAWDVAAYINAQPRPGHPFLQKDWPRIEKKPVDHPFGPYADAFSENQHKFGPFGPIVAFYKSQKKN
jgi:thiosulfate dehydrogenase